MHGTIQASSDPHYRNAETQSSPVADFFALASVRTGLPHVYPGPAAHA